MELSREVIDRFLKVDPATVGHYVGSGFMRPAMKPVRRDEKRMVGTAYTVRLEGRDSSALYYAISKAPAGSVIVIDRCGDDTFACVGEMVAAYAQGRGMAGIVVDGPATDSVAISKMEMPVFCTAISCVTTLILGVSGEVGSVINCSGAIVRPGEIVFGDADGVVVLPRNGFEEPLRKAEISVENEVAQRKIFASGQLPGWDIDKLFETDVPAMLAGIWRNEK